MIRWRWLSVAGMYAPVVILIVAFAAPLPVRQAVAIAVAAYATGLVNAAALRGPVVALIDWRTRLDRDRWRRWCEEERAARREAERRLDELRALGGYRGIGSVGRSMEVPRG